MGILIRFIERQTSRSSLSFRVFIKYLMLFSVGFIYYYLATIGILMFLISCSLIPLILMVISSFSKKLDVFNEVFRTTKIAKIKFLTFVAQNFVLFIGYVYGSNTQISYIATWIYRINVIEVCLDCFQTGNYLFGILSIPLLRWFFDCTKHPKYLVLHSSPDDLFVLEYTLWFFGWIANRPHPTDKRFLITAHTLFPLFVPLPYWFSVRTITGMYMLFLGSSSIDFAEFTIFEADIAPLLKAATSIYDPVTFIVLVSYWLKRYIVK